ncbi:hypothetical protein STEG23_027433 [Scotinomys teguina]
MSAVMLLPGTNGSLLLVQRTVTRTIVLQETIGKDRHELLPQSIYSGQNEESPPVLISNNNLTSNEKDAYMC